MGFALRFVRDLYTKINQLNEEIKIKNLELQAAAFKDPLTELHNRRYVKDVLMEQVAIFLKQLTTPEFAMRNLDLENKVLFLMIADIDNFKAINDAYGHVTGDEVLTEVSKRIRESVRFDDTVVRWGGEEFLIICPMMNRDAAEFVIGKLLDGVRSTPIRLSDTTAFTITISIGAIWIPAIRQFPYFLSFDKSLMIADQALYDAKTIGRNHGRLVVLRENATILHEKPLPEFTDKLYKDPNYCEIKVVGMQ
jgi:diguanylate cyclase (GGDEF)-like protein